MGVFDSVYVECPHCGSRVEHQSKADSDPYMNSYTLADAPPHILRDVLNEPHYCAKCGNWHALYHPDYPPGEPPPPLDGVRAVKVRTPSDAEIQIHDSQPWLRWWWTDAMPFTRADIEDEV